MTTIIFGWVPKKTRNQILFDVSFTDVVFAPSTVASTFC